jgi:hypothetical protein
MSGIDQFASKLFEQAKHFLEKAKGEDSEAGKESYLNAALLLGVSALEAHVNAVADEMLMYRDISLLDRSILSEKDYQLENGEFKLINHLKMYRLLDRIQYLHVRFSDSSLDKTSNWWGQVNNAIHTRNSIVHPREKLLLKQEVVESSLQGILEALDALYRALYKKSYPALGRKLDSNLNF